jgi:hypothetical protein
VLVLHRRAGKSTAIILQHQRAATDDQWERRRLRTLAPDIGDALIADRLRGRVYGHVMPTRVQAKLTVWDLMKHYAAAVPGATPNESELRIDYPNGCRVQLFGADYPDALRGPAFSGLSFDEYGLHPPNIFSEVLSKNLADHFGYAIFAGTIKGKNQLYRTYEAAKGDAAGWFTCWQDVEVSLSTESPDTTVLLRQAMEDDRELIAKGLMSQEEYDQEWFLSVDAAVKGAYYAKEIAQARREHRIRPVPYDPALRVHDVWDLGKGPNMAVGLFQRTGREVHLIDYLEGAESDGLPQMIATLQRKPYVYGKHFAPHDIAATDLSTGKTRLQTAQALGWPFEIVPKLAVEDGINAGRLMFARLWVDETKCGPWLEAMGLYRREWHDRLGIFGDRPVHDFTSHPADMYRYAAVAEDLMTNEIDPVALDPTPMYGRSWMG